MVTDRVDERTGRVRPPFQAGGAARLLVVGGLVLIAAGLIFGDVYAVFILHQNAGRIGEELLAATRAVGAGEVAEVTARFAAIGPLLENRGTKVDAHAHVIAFGYLALLLALIQPYVALTERTRRRLAGVFLAGAVLLPPSVVAIHYVGLACSPLSSIGWASIAADLGGVLVIVACVGELVGLWRYRRDATGRVAAPARVDRAGVSRLLLSGGMLLVLLGFLHGAYYAGVLLDAHAARDVALVRSMVEEAAGGNLPAAEAAVAGYGVLQAEKAVHVAAHAHVIEFGLLAMLVAFIQPLVMFGERGKRRLALLLLAGSVVLPVFVLAELWWGLVAGAIADLGGLGVIVALLGMLAGVLRHTGALDVGRETVP